MKDLFKGCLTIPNLLSVIRIVLIPVFAVLFLGDHQIAALIVLAVSGLTDLFDGKIARRFNQVSALGKILDPVADKLTQITIAVILFILFRNADSTLINAFGWVFLVFLIKEAVMVIGGLVMLLMNIRPGAAEMPGKVATAAFYGIMILIIGFGPEVGAFRSLLLSLLQAICPKHTDSSVNISEKRKRQNHQSKISNSLNIGAIYEKCALQQV